MTILKLQNAMNSFRYKCFKKLLDKEGQGYTGWDNASAISNKELTEKLKENIHSEDWVDVANLAMILNYRQSHE